MVIGLLLFSTGLYLLLNAIHVTNSFSMAYSLYRWHGYSLTSGMVMVPFMLGVGWIFFNPKSWGGYILAFGSLGALILGVITSSHFHLRPMTAFDLILIVVPMVGGIGLMLRSLKRQIA